MADRLADPYSKKVILPKTAAQPQPANGISAGIAAEPEEYAEIYCSMAKHILLYFFTFGIWYLIWIHKSTKYLNRAPEGQQYDPTKKLLLVLFVPFYQIYWYYTHGKKLESFMKARNITGSDMATLCLILGIFAPFIACFLMQDKYNQLCTSTAATPQTASTAEPGASTENSAIEAIAKYKDLLDAGAITEEEFDTKKKQLLGL